MTLSDSQSRKICFFSIATHFGGAEKSLLDLVTRLEENSNGRYRPWLLFPKNRGPLIDACAAHKISYSSVELSRDFLEISRSKRLQSISALLRATPGLPFHFFKILQQIRKHSPALIHTTGLKCHLIAAALEPFHRKPILWHLRDILEPGFTLNLFKGFQHMPGIHLTANSIATAGPLNSGKQTIPVIYNGLNSSDFEGPRHRVLHKRLGLSDSVPLVGILGVLARWKGQIEFVRMARRMIDSGSPAHFAIIGGEIYDTSGEKGYTDELRSEILKQRLENRVHLLGFEKNPIPVLKSLDVLVHASIKPEPFGRVIIEAMAAGTPVVASAQGGVLEIVENESNGLLFSAGNVLAMADAVNRLLGSAEFTEKLVKNGLHTFKSKFTVEAHLRTVIQLYDRILGVQDETRRKP